MKQTEFIEKMSGIDPKFVSEAANYKPKRANYIKVIAIAACLAMMLTTLTVWGLTLTSNESAEEPIEEPSVKVLSFKAYMEENPGFRLSEESLAELYQELDTVIEEYDVIEFENNGFIYYFLRSCRNSCKEGCHNGCEPGCLGLFADCVNEYTTYYDENGSWCVEYSNFTVSTDEDADTDTLKYLMFLSYICFETPETVAFGDYDYKPSMNRNMFHYIFLSYDYVELGYDTALDYLKATRSGEAEMGDNSYRVDYNSRKRIYKFNSKFSERENLWQKVSKE